MNPDRGAAVVCDAACWLALLCAADIKRQVAKRVLQRWCLQEGQPAAALFEHTPAELAERLDLAPEQAQQIWQQRAEIPHYAALLAELEPRGIGVLTRADVAYPDVLAERLPEERLPYFLYYRGNLAIATQPGVALWGAARPAEPALELARALATALAQDGHQLVGGYARGVERAALDAARATGGACTLVLPLGMNPFSATLDAMGEALAGGRLLALSPYACDVPYSEALADARLGLIAALSAVLVVIAPERGPEVWQAETLLRAGALGVLAWTGSDDAHTAAWLRIGAQPFDDVATAQAQIAQWLGTTAIGDATQEPSSRDEGPPIAFEDADTAIETLERTGKVPEVLARRLRERDGHLSGKP